MRLLLTGASGSFGTAFLAHVFRHRLVERAVAFSRNEHSLAALGDRLGHQSWLRLMVGDVRDPERIQEALDRVDTVICAAALKRVDVVNSDVREIMATNYQGSVNTIRAAVRRNVPRVLLISSDKACAPATIYGVSKLAAEHYAIQANAVGHPHSRISAVRYGNVAGSQGSVIPLWRRQHAQGLPLTLTDVRMTRFWLTMSSAVAFVLAALRDMVGGEVFIPRARASTLRAVAKAIGGEDWPICLVGYRGAGEKLHETLLSADESGFASDLGDRFILHPAAPAWPYGRRTAEDRLLPPGYCYRSDTAPQMDADDLRTMLATIGDETP